MSFCQFSKLLVCTIIMYSFLNTNISLHNKQGINLSVANASNRGFKTIEPYTSIRPSPEPIIETRDFDVEEEELPEISDFQEAPAEYKDEFFAYDFFSFDKDEIFSKVGILLPLTGDAKEIGLSMLKAAETALFDIGNPNVELVIEDTKGTPLGAKMAAQLAISKGAQIIVGPVFSKTTEEIQRTSRQHGVNIISFSNDWKLANKNTFLMGFMPYYQVMEILNYAKNKNYERLAVILPNDAYGDLVEEILSSTNIIPVVKSARIAKEDNVQDFIKEFSGYNDRKQTLEDEVIFYQTYMEELEELSSEINNKDIQKQMSDEEFFYKYARYKELKSIEASIQSQLDMLDKKTTEGKIEFDCILLPFGGDKLREIASLLSYYDIPPEKVKYLGTGLFDDKTLNDEPSLVKAWYAAPYSKKLKTFRKNYKNIYNEEPIRIASLAYDAISLLASLAEIEELPNYKNLTNSAGFIGIDGMFKFNKNGLIERKLSIMEIQKRKSPRKISH